MTPQESIPISAVPGLVWPAVPTQHASMFAAVMFQLEQTQWWDAERLADAQFAQLRHVVAHGYTHSPEYRDLLDEAGVSPADGDVRDLWPNLPLLTRDRVWDAGERLNALAVPKEHGNVENRVTSGSTGSPITVRRSELGYMLWMAFTLRDHFWHKRDLSGKLAAIRAHPHDLPRTGEVSKNWGQATRMLYNTGPAALQSIFEDMPTQLEFLIEQNPHYLLSNPSNLRALAMHCDAVGKSGDDIPNLREVRSMGEMIPDDLRDWVRDVWGVPTSDMYSCEEVGYIALQCPVEGHTHYHVQSENVLVEVLDENNQPCAPGEVGRVVLSALHNFATPVIRYAIGDYAEVGEPCDCGRGLPVLNRIMGRQRNMITLPDGSKHWPGFHAKLWKDIAPIRQLQFVQDAVDHIEAKIVMDREFTDDERGRFVEAIQNRMGFPHPIDVTYVDEIPRSKGGKYEDFVSLLEEERHGGTEAQRHGGS